MNRIIIFGIQPLVRDYRQCIVTLCILQYIDWLFKCPLCEVCAGVSVCVQCFDVCGTRGPPSDTEGLQEPGEGES